MSLQVSLKLKLSKQIKKISLPDSSLSHEICIVTKKNENNEIVQDFVNYIKSNI